MGKQPEEGPRDAWHRPRRRSPWTAALLAGSVLCSCFLLTEGQALMLPISPINILLKPPHPVKGQDVTLIQFPGDHLEYANTCRWYRGWRPEEKNLILTYYFLPTNKHTNGAAFSGREIADPNCYLHIRNLKPEDTGIYSVVVDLPETYAVGRAFIVVSGPISSSSSTQIPILRQPAHPIEGQDVFLTPGYRVKEATTCRWYRGLGTEVKNLILTYNFPPINQQTSGPAFTGRETAGPICSLHIRNLTPEDSGSYRVDMEGPGIDFVGGTSVSVSGSISSSSSTQIPILRQPAHPIEGQDVFLTPGYHVKEAATCHWYRGWGTEVKNLILTYYFPPTNWQGNGTAFTGRETAGPGCSLHIRNLTPEDTGNYTMNVDLPGINVVGYTFVVISAPVPVSLEGYRILSIIFGSLAVAALIIGTLLYFFLRARGRSVTVSMHTTAATSTYENDAPSRRVETDNSADSNHVYQDKQYQGKFPPLLSSQGQDSCPPFHPVA